MQIPYVNDVFDENEYCLPKRSNSRNWEDFLNKKTIPSIVSIARGCWRYVNTWYHISDADELCSFGESSIKRNKMPRNNFICNRINRASFKKIIPAEQCFHSNWFFLTDGYPVYTVCISRQSNIKLLNWPVAWN